MGEFFGELAGAIGEAFFNLIGKSKPKDMPDIEYKSNFTVKHSGTATLAKCLLSFAIIVGSMIGFFLTRNDSETYPLFIVFAVLGAIVLFMPLYAYMAKYIVDEEKIIICGMFKRKTLLWSDVICIRKIKRENESELTFILYDKNGKFACDFSTDMENAWYVPKMAEAKEIEIREEKELLMRYLTKL